MAESDETVWVSDALIEFLQGSFWTTSILNFMEEKSLIFEPDTSDSKEYREIHEEYKNFVNLLLDFYMEDMGITPEQFEKACTLIKNTRIAMKLQQGLFEQIWAANEYEVFKRMMIQKNLELQLQSLKMIEQKYGLTPASLTHEVSELLDHGSPSKEKLETETSNETTGEKIQPDVSMDLKKDESVPQLKPEQCEAKYNQASTPESLNKSIAEGLFDPKEDEQETNFNIDYQVPVEELSDHDESEAKYAAVVDTSSIISPPPPPTSPINSRDEFSVKPKEETREEDIRSRQVYLNAQRDKLLALKKKTRNHKTRPSSARVVADATVDVKQQDLIAQQEAMDAQILRVRRALAARLRAEVVQK